MTKASITPIYTEGWTPQRELDLRKYWAENRSGSEIAALLGGLTRCAVLGKAWRLGLPARSESSKLSRKKRKFKTAPPAAVKPPLAPKPVTLVASMCLPILKALVTEMHKTIEEPPAEGIDILDLEKHHCRYITSGDGIRAKFCGARKMDDSSYCSEHRKICISGKYESYRAPKKQQWETEEAA